uniref:Ribonuclease A family member 1, pancreatic n=1 Tax=Labrus bergylta TaxID=56723 RepID=A0A3Q3EEE4_9LABR
MIQFALLLLLSVLCIAAAENDHDKFIRQHVIDKMEEGDCTTEINRRNIKNKAGKCKEINTFILSNKSAIMAVCMKGEPYEVIVNKILTSMTKSTTKFSIIKCKLKNQKASPPKCQYVGTRGQRSIIIKCDKEGHPVHYQGDNSTTL